MRNNSVTSALAILESQTALARIAPGDIARLTEAATNATFYRDDLNPEQRAANRRIVDVSEATARIAAASPNQNFAAAFVNDRFAGFVIASRHGEADLELDWLMVHPDFHGTDVAASLMRHGIAWLGETNPIWLNVIRHNERAIRFYRRFGFAIDPAARMDHVVPHVIMRRVPMHSG
ncbi:MAG: GNAT family N-acetyltransferase [Alphaproteobacteria bacterium]|nr:GNAT family N-acetyltransferase [Alphaproteobacteria bacterium]